MGIARGPNLVKDNLVFGYDTGYGVADNSTATRFYPGENTANLFLSPNFTNHTDTTVGTTSIVKEDFGDGKIGIRMIQEGTSDIASFSMGSYSAPSSAGTYTWSSCIHSTSTGGKVKAQVTVYVNGTRHWLTNSNTWTTSVTECSHLFIATIANQWHRIENQFTLPTGTLTNLQLGSFYRTTSNFTIKLANAQFELKQHTTPFVDGTRSSTQSLIDLKRSTDIDVSNVSFSSTGQPEFDGTDDIITQSRIIDTASYSAEFVFKADVNTSGTEHWLGSQYPGTGRVIFDLYTNNRLRNFINGTSINGATTIATGNWYHAVFTRNSSGVAYIYLNGVQDATGTISTSTPVNDPFDIGGSTTLTRWFNGNIAVVKIYNTDLTAAQAAHNFNAYKNRFNI